MDFIIDHLSKSYEQKKVLEDVSFRFSSGKIYGLLGRNGAGKTTLFNCLNRDITADGGTFFFEDEQGRREVEPEDIGYVLSTPTVPDFLTGREFLKFFMDINRGSITDPKPLDDYFDFISIPAEDRDRLMKDYSHGMKNKMQMLINFIANPTLFLLDEPIGGVDPAARDYILNTIIANYNENATVLISTHLISDVEQILDDVIFINQGSVVLTSSVDDIREKQDKSVDALFREVFRC